MRLPAEADLDAWARWMGDAETMKYLGTGAVMSRDDAWRNLAMMIGHWHLRGFGMWLMEEKATGKPVGRGGLWQPEGWPGLEVGWLVAPEARGKGFATEMAHVALDSAFSVLGRSEVLSLILPENQKSIEVAQRIGCTFAKEIELRGFKVSQYAVSRRSWRQPISR